MKYQGSCCQAHERHTLRECVELGTIVLSRRELNQSALLALITRYQTYALFVADRIWKTKSSKPLSTGFGDFELSRPAVRPCWWRRIRRRSALSQPLPRQLRTRTQRHQLGLCDIPMHWRHAAIGGGD